MKFIKVLVQPIKQLLNFLLNRVSIVIFMILLQLFLIIVVPLYFAPAIIPSKVIFYTITIFAILVLLSDDNNPHFKVTWLVLFFFLPYAGGAIYLLFSHRWMSPKLQRQLKSRTEDFDHHIPCDSIAEPTHPDNLHHSRYIWDLSGYPPSPNTQVVYYEVGEDMLEGIFESIKKAKRYIFLEFFIVKPGQILTQLLELLEERIKSGVQVYFMYDDLGTIFSLPYSFPEKLKKMGIQVCVFNPFRPHFSPMLNYRDHRKILVVDGESAFCGGINIADEYANIEERFGHWKDTGVKLTGAGAWNFALMFLQQWHFGTGEKLPTEEFIPSLQTLPPSDGVVQIYGDSPLSNHNIAENVYLSSIRQAKKYIYIVTPYLVIDNAMVDSLCAAAASGVDVRIITPHKYDKWYVHILTRSHYGKLIKEGVNIYEYTPGFIHGKMFVSDDIISMVGTSNMDFRSLYLHFECSVMLYENSALWAVKADVLKTIAVSQHITQAALAKTPWYIKALQYLLKAFAPLM